MGLKVQLLEESFAVVAPQGEELTDVFYRNLFADFPAVKPLFANVEMGEQRKKLLAALKLTVENLRKPENLVPALENLGLRHVDYGAREEHYPAVGQTLLKSLSEVRRRSLDRRTQRGLGGSLRRNRQDHVGRSPARCQLTRNVSLINPIMFRSGLTDIPQGSIASSRGSSVRDTPGLRTNTPLHAGGVPATLSVEHGDGAAWNRLPPSERVARGPNSAKIWGYLVKAGGGLVRCRRRFRFRQPQLRLPDGQTIRCKTCQKRPRLHRRRASPSDVCSTTKISTCSAS